MGRRDGRTDLGHQRVGFIDHSFGCGIKRAIRGGSVQAKHQQLFCKILQHHLALLEQGEESVVIRRRIDFAVGLARQGIRVCANGERSTCRLDATG